MTIGQRINEIRIERNMTMRQLAKSSGVSYDTINSWVYRGYHPDIELLIMVADVFGVTLDELVGRKFEKVTE